MCGIAGCVQPLGTSVPRAPLERMVAALHHRGPDDSAIITTANVGLAHTRLAILDPTAAGRQPMSTPDRRWWISYNGEAFNHLELRQRLPKVKYHSGTDTETVLHALATLGENAVPLVNGLFAYAALDTEGGRLLLVRDRFGVKPLYLAEHDGALWFASEIGALLAAGVPRIATVDVLAHAVDRGWANGTRTPIQGVESVAPGTLVTIDTCTLQRVHRGWYEPSDQVDSDRQASLSRAGPRDAARIVESELRSSVARRLLSDVPLGVMCSGGVDSSLIAAYASERQPVAAFTASIVDQPENDEAPFARMVAKHLGLELHVVPMDGERWRRELVSTVLHTEMPLLHPSSVPMGLIAQEAASLGTKVLLSGEGADELFSGYPWMDATRWSELAHGRRWLRDTARSLRRLARRQDGSLDPSPGRGPCATIREHELARVRAAQARYPHLRGPARALTASALTQLDTYLPHLLHRQDRSTMLASVETRVPFLDPNLVGVALNLPIEWRALPVRKAILVELARRRVPSEALDRPKVGFGFDVGRYLAAARPEFIARGRLREVLGVSGPDWSAALPTFGARSPLLLYTGEIWARLFLDGNSVEAVDEALWKR